MACLFRTVFRENGIGVARRWRSCWSQGAPRRQRRRSTVTWRVALTATWAAGAGDRTHDGDRRLRRRAAFSANRPVMRDVVKAGGGRIDTDGNYTAPLSPGTFHVHAATTDAPSQEATATVTVGDGSITLVAGSFGGQGNADDTGGAARFGDPRHLAFGKQYVTSATSRRCAVSISRRAPSSRSPAARPTGTATSTVPAARPSSGGLVSRARRAGSALRQRCAEQHAAEDRSRDSRSHNGGRTGGEPGMDQRHRHRRIIQFSVGPRRGRRRRQALHRRRTQRLDPRLRPGDEERHDADHEPVGAGRPRSRRRRACCTSPTQQGTSSPSTSAAARRRSSQDRRRACVTESAAGRTKMESVRSR